MLNGTFDNHLLILVLIMIFSGAFGGYLNYLHNFDTTDNDLKDSKVVKYKYILLGIGAAFLVPAFLKMISSTLISSKDNIDYLIFIGFCLIASIFSRRFITNIGDRILEAAKRAEKSARENKKDIAAAQIEITSTKERIEDVKLAVDIANTEVIQAQQTDGQQPMQELLKLANTYVEITSIPDYNARIKLKGEIGRRMGEIVVRNKLPKHEILEANQTEGMLLALSNSIQLRPDLESLNILNQISNRASQLHTKYSILIAYDTLARNNFIPKERVREIYEIIIQFRKSADRPLLRKLDETIKILSLISSEIPVEIQLPTT